MRRNETLVGTRREPISAVRPQPHERHAAELRAGVPVRPWGSRGLPPRLLADDSRRTLFRSLLRRAEGVPVEFADGATGVVENLVYGALGFDFWPIELLVRVGDRTPSRDRIRRVPVNVIRWIDVREPRIAIGATRAEPIADRGLPSAQSITHVGVADARDDVPALPGTLAVQMGRRWSGPRGRGSGEVAATVANRPRDADPRITSSYNVSHRV